MLTNTPIYVIIEKGPNMKITDITLFVGYNESDDFRILINAKDQETAQQLADEFANNSELGHMEVTELTEDDIATLFVGYSKSDDFRILINAESQEEAQQYADEYIGNMEVTKLTETDLSKCLDYIITENNTNRGD